MKKIITLSALVLFSCFFLGVHAQEREISGKVTSKDDSKPISGVTVIVKGTTLGASTDLEGNYKIVNVPPNSKTLVFSAIGLKTMEIEIGASNNIDAVLETDALKLDQVVVTANAISREKRSLGYATTQVDNQELTQGDNTNVIGALQGKVAGVDVSSLSGSPGSSQRITIRGGSSLLFENQPLIVVDGIPISNANNRTPDPTNQFAANDLNDQTDFGNRGNDIDPDDIESISVLKGPAAAALYGSQASNGAIIITTKKGRKAPGAKSKTEVSYSSSLTLSSVLKLPDFQNEFGQGNVDPNEIADDRRENFSWGLPFNGQERPWGQTINGTEQIKPYVAIPDNVKDFFNTGAAYNNHVSFSGGTDKSSYLMSISALNSTGVIPTTSYDKYNVLFNGSSELTNHFTTAISLNYANISSQLPSGGQGNNSVYQNLLLTPRDIPIVDGKNLSNPFNSYNDVTGTYGFYAGYTINPYFVLNNYRSYDNVDRMFGNITISYHNWSWLDITDRLGGDVISDRREEDWKKFNYSPLDDSNIGYDWGPQTSVGKYQEDNYNTLNYTNDFMLTFKRKLTNDITSSLLVGQNIKQYKTTELFAETNVLGGLNLPGYYNLANSNGSPVNFNQLIEKRIVGFYADLNLAYKNYLFLGLTGRNDESSSLYGTPTDQYFYPSVNASFVFSELMHSKLKDNILSYGKLRASYAKVGNDAPPYATGTVYNVTNISGNFGNTQFPFQYPNQAVPGYTVNDQLGNNKIAPEFTTASEVGTELGFLKDRLSVDFSYYMNSSTNQIIPLPLPYSTGFTSEYINAGEVQNKGVELAVRGVPILSKSGFKWELYGTYTKNTSDVVSLYGGVQQIVLGGFAGMSVVAQVGQPYGALYAIDVQTENGHVIVNPSTGIPFATANQVDKGSYLPKFIASWGTDLSYKGFKLNVLFDTKQGGVFYSNTKSLTDFDGTSTLTTTNNRQDYVWPGSVYLNSQGQYVANTTPFHQYTYYTSYEQTLYGHQILDASYIKLREVSLSYEFPHKWIHGTPFGTASVGIFGNNLVLWTPKSNPYVDPEENSSGASNAQGFEFNPTPSQRNYGVILKFTF